MKRAIKDERAIETVMESMMWNLATTRMLCGLTKFDSSWMAVIRTLAWVLGMKGAFNFPDHYETTGSHSTPGKDGASEATQREYEIIVQELYNYEKE